MAYNFLDPKTGVDATLNRQNLDAARGIFALPTTVPVFESPSGLFNRSTSGGMRRPGGFADDEMMDELDTTKMTDEEKRRVATGAPAAPEFFPAGSPATRFLETAGAVASAVPRVANLIPQAAANAFLPEGMRLRPAPAAPVAPEVTAPAAPRPQAPTPPTPPAPETPRVQAPVAPTPAAPAAPRAEGMRAAPRLNILGEPVQTLDAQGGYKVYGPGGAVATEIPWNTTDESALRRTLTRDEYLASQAVPGFAEGSRAAAANASNELQQRIQADANRDVAGLGMQRAQQEAAAKLAQAQTQRQAVRGDDAIKKLDQLSPAILGGIDSKTGEFLPGALDQDEDTATAVFKQSLSDVGVPASELEGYGFRWDSDRRVMQVLDSSGAVVDEGSPTGLGKKAYERYFGRI